MSCTDVTCFAGRTRTAAFGCLDAAERIVGACRTGLAVRGRRFKLRVVDVERVVALEAVARGDSGMAEETIGPGTTGLARAGAELVAECAAVVVGEVEWDVVECMDDGEGEKTEDEDDVEGVEQGVGHGHGCMCCVAVLGRACNTGKDRFVWFEE